MHKPVDNLSKIVGAIVFVALAAMTAYLYWPTPKESSEEPPIRATGTIGNQYVDAFGFFFVIPKGWQVFTEKNTAALSVTKGGAQVKMEKFATSSVSVSVPDSAPFSLSYDHKALVWKSGSERISPLFLTASGLPVFGAPKGYVVALTYTKFVYISAGVGAGDSDARKIAESTILLKEE